VCVCVCALRVCCRGDVSIVAPPHTPDRYNLEPALTTDGMSAGASRFVALVKKLKAELDPLVLFSGDVFNPSVCTLLGGAVACAVERGKWRVEAQLVSSCGLCFLWVWVQ